VRKNKERENAAIYKQYLEEMIRVWIIWSCS